MWIGLQAGAEQISVRPVPGGGSVAKWMVAEDRALLRGDAHGDAEPESLGCPNCGAPVTADGSKRRLACEVCASEVVVPDEVWRRVHSPNAVATWFLWAAAASPDQFKGDLSFQKFQVGEGGRVYAIGTYNGDEVLLALDTVNVANTNGVQAVVGMGDGTVIVHCYPSNRLERVDLEGKLRNLWPPSGLLGSIFGWDRGGMAYDKPVARPGTVTQGSIGRAHGGGLCVVCRLSGTSVGLLDNQGKLLRTVPVDDMVLDDKSGVNPILAVGSVGPDGDVWLAGSEGIERYRSDGKLRWHWYLPD